MCTNSKHTIENIQASVPVILKDGSRKNILVTAGHCAKCKAYFIMESTYFELKQAGIISCRVYDEKTYRKHANVI